MEVAKRYQAHLQDIKDKVKKSYESFQHNYMRFNEFRKFVFDTSLSADDVTLLATLSKPQLEFNITEAYISRLMGEFSKQEPAISVSAEEGVGADPVTVDVVEKHLRHIMFDTKNNPVQIEVMKDLYSGGFSAFKIWTDYANDHSFDQKIFVDRVYDPTLVGFDQLARQPNKGDGEFCFELFPMERSKFESEFPDVDTSRLNFTGSFSSFNWSYLNGNEEVILVCEYYAKKRTKTRIVQLVDGRVMTLSEYEKLVASWGMFMQPPAIKGKPRTTQIETIVRYRCIENQVIEYTETDFSFFPLVFVDGNSIMLKNTDTGGSAYQMTRPYVYHAKGAQRLKNFSGISLANEIENVIQHKIMIAKEALPKEMDWLEAYKDIQKPNTFVYNAFVENDPDKQIPNPIREVQRIPAPPEVMQAFVSTDSLVQNILGSYDASLGINDNQLSGVAIQEGATQSNAAAMPYITGFLHGWQRVAEIIVDLMPKYYKTPRTLPVMGIDGKRDFVLLNQQGGVSLDYDRNALNVRVEAGVSYQIEKSRALQQMISLMQASPLFDQFMNEKGLPVLLDNMEIRGIDMLKDMVEEWMVEMQQQKQMMMQQQMNQPNPQMIKAQIDQQKLQLEQEKVQDARMKMAQEQEKDATQFLIDKERLAMDQQKVLTDALASHNNNAVQMVKAETERFAKQADLAMQHRQHALEALKIHTQRQHKESSHGR